jgi:hypothetical protein
MNNTWVFATIGAVIFDENGGKSKNNKTGCF